MKLLLNIVGFLFRRFFEFGYIFILRIINYRFYNKEIKNQYGEESEYAFARRKIQVNGRADGISGFYRVKNEEELLVVSLDSHIPYLDEIIIVYNDCSDKTQEIARGYAKKYPHKIKVYEYKPKVYPALSMEHTITPSDSPHSLVNYYNYALSKTTKKVAVKIDADHIAVTTQFKKVVENIRRNNIDTMHYFFGVNLFMLKDKFCVNMRQPLTHGLDCGFFPVSMDTFFVHRRKCESLRFPIKMYFTRISLGVLFYHLKGIKKDRGVGSLKKISSKDADKVKEHLYNPKLISWGEYKKMNKNKLRGISNPNDVISL